MIPVRDIEDIEKQAWSLWAPTFAERMTPAERRELRTAHEAFMIRLRRLLSYFSSVGEALGAWPELAAILPPRLKHAKPLPKMHTLADDMEYLNEAIVTRKVVNATLG